MNVTVNVSGLEGLKANLDRIGRNMDAELAKAAKDGMIIYVEGPAKRNTPVDTGRLRSSIVTVADSETVATGTNVDYAPFQEFGTSRMKAHAFLRPAFDEGKSRVIDHISKEIAKAGKP